MFVFGSLPNSFAQPQNSLLAVASSQCTSSPMTVSHVLLSVAHRTRPDYRAMTPPPDPEHFTTHRAEVRNGVTIAYAREGVGGIPLLLLHGYPETKRIWWRNIGPLADAGLRGDRARLPRPRRLEPRARRLLRHRRVLDRLLHARARRARPRALRGRRRRRRRRRALRPRPALSRLRAPSRCCFNTVPPPLNDVYDAAGLAARRRARAARDRRLLRPPGDRARRAPRRARHARAPRSAWVADMYGHRLWGTPNAFTAEEVAFHTEPYARRRQAPRELGRVRAERRQPRDGGRARSCSNGHRSRRSCCTGPRTTWCCRRSRGRRRRVHRLHRPAVRPERGPLPAVGSGRDLQQDHGRVLPS